MRPPPREEGRITTERDYGTAYSNGVYVIVSGGHRRTFLGGSYNDGSTTSLLDGCQRVPYQDARRQNLSPGETLPSFLTIPGQRCKDFAIAAVCLCFCEQDNFKKNVDGFGSDFLGRWTVSLR